MKSKVLTFVGREYMIRAGRKGDPVSRVSPTERELEMLETAALTARKIIRLGPLMYLVLDE